MQMFAVRRGPRSFDEALAVLSPLEVSESAVAYVEQLSPEQLRERIQRGIKALDDAERAQLAMWLEDRPARESVSADDLRAVVASTPDPRARFAAYLRANPRCTSVLGADAADAVLAPFGETLDERIQEHRVAPRRLSPASLALVAAVLVLAFVPLVAQYMNQRGMLSGIAGITAAPIALTQRLARFSAHHFASAHHVGTHVRHRGAIRERRPHAARHPKRVVALRRPVRLVHHATARRTIARHEHHAAPAVWKFNPRYNPYLNRRRWRSVRRLHRLAQSAPQRLFERRAQLVVASYLHAIARGDKGTALAHLGLPRTAAWANLSEARIVGRGTHVAIVGTKSTQNGGAQVQADIAGRKGEYFEIFTLHRDGPAVRIADRYFIPVNHRAEAITAHSIAVSHR